MDSTADRSAGSNGTHDEAASLLSGLLETTPVATHNHRLNDKKASRLQSRESDHAIHKDSTPQPETLLKQYEQSLNEIRHLDGSNLQITLLFILLISAYIGAVGKGLQLPKGVELHVMFSFGLAIFGTCIIGIIRRLRFLIREHKKVVFGIEKILRMIRYTEDAMEGFARIRMSAYLEITVVALTSLAIALTLLT